MIPLRPLLGAASLATLTAVLPSMAAAHAELKSSTPGAGENLGAAPTKVTLTFDDELNPDGSSFTVADAGGHVVGTGEVDLTVPDRNVLVGDVTITSPGVYTVAYVAVAGDGHEASGTLSFGYRAEQAIPDPTSREGPDTALPRQTAPAATLVGTLLLVLAGVIGLRRLALR